MIAIEQRIEQLQRERGLTDEQTAVEIELDLIAFEAEGLIEPIGEDGWIHEIPHERWVRA